MLKVVFMGTPEISVPALEAISKEFEVVAVYTQPDRPVGRGLEVQQSAIKKTALRLGLTVKQPEKINQDEALKELKAFEADVFVVSAYAQILKRSILDLPRLGCVNIHFSLLPRWRGAAPVQYSILEGDSETGVTTMLMNEGLDTGDVLERVSCAIGADEKSDQLAQKLAQLAAPLICQTLKGLSSHSLSPVKQDDSKATHAKKLNKDLQWLSSSQTAVEMDRRVRALFPWPGTSIKLESNQRVKVLEGKPWPALKSEAGYLQEKNGMLLLGCSQGAYEITRLQLEGKKPQDAGTFLNGLKGQGKALPMQVL